MHADKPPVDIRDGPDAVRNAVLNELSTFTLIGGENKVEEIRPKLTGATSSPFELDVAFYAALWSLVSDGIIVPGKAAAMHRNYRGDEDLRFPYFTITPFGREILEKPGASNPYVHMHILTTRRRDLVQRMM